MRLNNNKKAEVAQTSVKSSFEATVIQHLRDERNIKKLIQFDKRHRQTFSISH